MAEGLEITMRNGSPLRRIGGKLYARLEPWTLDDTIRIYDDFLMNETTAPRSEWALGDEAVTLLRAIRKAYYADARHWGTPGMGEDDARRFMWAFERLMTQASPELQTRLMAGGPHSEPQHTTLEVP